MSDVDEIKKLKKLLDDGIITENDFNNQKKRILGLNSQEDIKVENSIEEKENVLKNTLDNYEATLINEFAEENNSIEKASKDETNDVEGSDLLENVNEDVVNDEERERKKVAEKIYDVEKVKEKARLDALSEKKKERNDEINQTINKGISKGIRIFKCFLAICCWIVGASSIMTSIEQNPIIYGAIGILFLILGIMACPKITDKTKEKYITYTKFKKIIVTIIVILIFTIMIVGG